MRDWNTETNRVVIDHLSNSFQVNHPVIGVDSNCTRLLTKYEENATQATYHIEVDPFTANKDSNWTTKESYDEKI